MFQKLSISFKRDCLFLIIECKLKELYPIIHYRTTVLLGYEPVTKGPCWALKKPKRLKLYNFAISSK